MSKYKNNERIFKKWTQTVISHLILLFCFNIFFFGRVLDFPLGSPVSFSKPVDNLERLLCTSAQTIENIFILKRRHEEL